MAWTEAAESADVWKGPAGTGEQAKPHVQKCNCCHVSSFFSVPDTFGVSFLDLTTPKI